MIFILWRGVLLVSCLIGMACIWYALGLFLVCGPVLACWYAVIISLVFLYAVGISWHGVAV